MRIPALRRCSAVSGFGFSLFLSACLATVKPAPMPRETVLTPPVPIYISTGGPVADPTLAIDSKGNLYAAWWGRGFGDIFFSRSSDGGDTWSAPRNVSNTPLSSDFPVLSVDPQDRLYLVWDDQSIIPFHAEAMISVSTDGGESWSPMKNISNTPANSSRPNLSVGPTGALSVVWLEGDDQIFFTRSIDGGATWSLPTDISGGHPPNRARAPALVEGAGGAIFAAWSVSNGQPFLTRSLNGGKTWLSPSPLTTAEPTVAPALALGANGTLYAAWSEASGLATDVVLSRSVDGGASFSESIDISRSPGVPSVDPAIAVDRHGAITCLWHEVIPRDTEVFMARSEDGGRSFTVPLNFSRTPGNSLAPRLVLDHQGNLFGLWEQGVKEAILFSRTR